LPSTINCKFNIFMKLFIFFYNVFQTSSILSSSVDKIIFLSDCFDNERTTSTTDFRSSDFVVELSISRQPSSTSTIESNRSSSTGFGRLFLPTTFGFRSFFFFVEIVFFGGGTTFILLRRRICDEDFEFAFLMSI
jgi:hypothetical protein